MVRYPLGLLALATLPGPEVAASPPPAQTLLAAADVLDEFAALPRGGVPLTLLANAYGVAVVPRVIKAGLVVGGRGGHGVVLFRDGSGRWGDPVFVTLGGASIGLQVGLEAADVVLVFRNRRSLDRLLAGKGKVTPGVDAAAAAGPVGRHAAAVTDGRLEAEILSYSRSRGLFAGASFDGAVVRPDADTNARFGRDTRPEMRALVAGLKSRLGVMSVAPPEVGAVPVYPAPVTSPEVPSRSAPAIRVGTALPSLPSVDDPEKVEMALSGLAAAVVGVAYRSLRRRGATGKWA